MPIKWDSPEIFDDLHADIEVQVYYELGVPQLPSWVSITEMEIEKATEDPKVAMELLEKLDAKKRFQTPICVGFTTFNLLVKYSQTIPSEKRKYCMPGLSKQYWIAPFRSLAIDLDQLHEALNNVLSFRQRPQPVQPMSLSQE